MAELLTTAEQAVLRASVLFAGLDGAELDAALAFMHARKRTFARGEFVQRIGEPVSHAGVVLSGGLVGSFNTAGYNEVALGKFDPGDTFAVTFAAAACEESPIQLVAQGSTTVLLVDLGCIGAGTGEGVEMKLARNLISMLVRQNMHLNRRVRVLGQDSIRNRVITYLGECPTDEGGFARIGLSQTDLAKYLGVNRSALSRELGRMRADGIIEADGRRMRLRQS